MLKELKNLTAFLTIIPVGMDSDCLTDAANYMHLFPAIGALVGFLAGLLAWALFHVFPNLIVGFLTLGFILLVTGLHHTDGLLDFGDGLMYQDSPEKKIEIMHDQQTGTGGLALGLITILTTAVCIAQLNANIIFQSLIVSEVSAKLAMVFLAWCGRSAHKGMNTYFVNAMHGDHRNLRLIIGLSISLAISLPMLQMAGFTAIVAGSITASVILWASGRHFKGVTGDVIGAANELARMSSLLSILAVMKWA